MLYLWWFQRSAEMKVCSGHMRENPLEFEVNVRILKDHLFWKNIVANYLEISSYGQDLQHLCPLPVKTEKHNHSKQCIICFAFCEKLIQFIGDFQTIWKNLCSLVANKLTCIRITKNWQTIKKKKKDFAELSFISLHAWKF